MCENRFSISGHTKRNVVLVPEPVALWFALLLAGWRIRRIWPERSIP